MSLSTDKRPRATEESDAAKTPVYMTEIAAQFFVENGDTGTGVVRKMSLNGLSLEADIVIEAGSVVTLVFPNEIRIEGKIQIEGPEEPPFCYQVIPVEAIETEEKRGTMVDLIADLLMSGLARSISS